MDNIHRIFLIIIIVAVAYFFFSLMFQLFLPQPQTMYEMMQRTMGSQALLQNIAAIILALVAGFVASMAIKPEKQAQIKKYDKGYALRIVKKKLSDDEKKLLKEVEKTGKITQDSLRARLEWSKAKTSTIITRLDKMDVIQRERAGKTYYVFLSKDLK